MTYQSFRAGRMRWLVLSFALLSGCAEWKHDVQHHATSEFARTRLPVDAVVLELEVIKIDDIDSQLELEMWQELDQQSVKLATRRQLADNGIQCGVSTMQQPVSLQSLVEKHRVRKSTDAESLADEETSQIRMQIRAGKPAQLITSTTYPVMSWVVSDEGYLHGSESYQARCQCILKTFPLGNGEVRIEVVPEITHGVSRQRIGVGGNALKYEMTQDKHVLNALKINANIAAGETLIVGNTDQAFGIGKKFFCDTEATGGSRKVILIRLAQIQFDDLFAPDRIVAPIATPTD